MDNRSRNSEKTWSDPKVEILDVDLASIATGTPTTTDASPGSHTPPPS